MSESANTLPPEEAWIESPDMRRFVLAGDCHFGRVEGNEIVIPEPRISRQHTVVRRQGADFVVVDLGSTNGTLLNNNRIFKPTRLRSGDVIKIGSLQYTFRNPAELHEPVSDESAIYRTMVVVSRVSCWMVLVTAPENPGAEVQRYVDDVRTALAARGAGVRRLKSGAVFAHWREGSTPPEGVRNAVLDLGRHAIPAGVRILVHKGAVRVGPSATQGEENLLGADVTYTHKLDEAGAELGTSLVLSKAAVESLALAGTAIALRSLPLRDLPGVHELFTLVRGA